MPAALGLMVAILWVLGASILGNRPDVGSLPSRIAIGKTDDGAALRLVLEGCDVTSVRRVTVRDEAGVVVWEVRGQSPPSRTSFVIGQTADPMSVSQPLVQPLESGMTYWVDVETDRVESLSFTLRSVPPVGVLHEGVETTTEGFHSMVRRQHCEAANRLPFAGSIAAQVLLVLAGAAFVVVAVGLLDRDR